MEEIQQQIEFHKEQIKILEKKRAEIKEQKQHNKFTKYLDRLIDMILTGQQKLLVLPINWHTVYNCSDLEEMGLNIQQIKLKFEESEFCYHYDSDGSVDYSEITNLGSPKLLNQDEIPDEYRHQVISEAWKELKKDDCLMKSDICYECDEDSRFTWSSSDDRAGTVNITIDDEFLCYITKIN